MHQRKVSALAALVGSASLGLAMGCGNGAHHEPTTQRSLDGTNDKQVARVADHEAPLAAESVPMPAWLRRDAAALLTPPIARAPQQGDSLGEPPLPQALATLAADQQPTVERRSGFKSPGHVQLVRTISPDGYTTGTVSGRQMVVEQRAPQASPHFAAVAGEPPAAEHPAAARSLRSGNEVKGSVAKGNVATGNLAAGNEVNSLSIISTTSVASSDVETAATASERVESVAPLADVASSDVAALTDVAEAEAAEPVGALAAVAAPAAQPERAIKSAPVAELAQSPVPTAVAAEAAVDSPRDLPRLRAELRPLMHPLATTEARRTSPHAKGSSAAAEALFGDKTDSTAHSYDATAAPSLIAIREVRSIPSTANAPTAAPIAKTSAATPTLAAVSPARSDAGQQIASKPVATPIVKSKPRVVVPSAQTPIAMGPVKADSITQNQPAVQPQTHAPAQSPVSAAPMPPQIVARRVTPRPAAPQPAPQNRPAPTQLAQSDAVVRSDATPQRIVTPVVAPHGSVKARVARTIPISRAPAQAGQPVARTPVSQEMLAVRKMADRHTFAGFDFASRRALYSAEAEFISSLRVLTRAMDRRTGSKEHAVALADGITALEESADFLASGSELEADFDVTMIVAGHRSSILRGADNLAEMTPLDAVQHYYSFAQERLADAVDGEPSGSFALYGLGKLHVSLAAEPGANPEMLEPKAMVYHQAALHTSPVNYMAANELAVLLARYGQLDEARNLLLHSISIAPQPSTWHNLAMVHAQLGEQQLAAAASAEQSFAQKRPGGNESEATVSAVQWLEPNEFSRTSDQARTPSGSSPTAQSTTKTRVHQTTASKKKNGGVFDMFKRK